MRVKVLRALHLRGERHAPGKIIDYPDHAAKEAIWMGKVEPVDESPPVSGPLTTEGAAAIVPGKTKTKPSK
jgi:hypothetical protein